MKALLLSISLFLTSSAVFAQRFTAPPDVPTTAPNSDFPVHARILVSHWSNVRGSYDGYGRGNILGDKPTGFDYTYSCGEPFLHNAERGEYYQARWKKQDQRLEMLMQKVGSDHQQKCELKVALKETPYGTAAPASATSAPASPPATAQPANPTAPN